MATAHIVDNLVRVLERHAQVRCDEVCWRCDNAELRAEPPLPFDKSAAQHRTSGVTAVWRASKAALMRRCTFTEPITSAHAQEKVTALRFAHPHTHLQVNASQFP